MEYAIAAIPTVYRGRRYRSRLEARWAAFFDLLGWEASYEPFDLFGWIPDFLLSGLPYRHNAANRRKVLVEVKPIDNFDPVSAEKMSKALYAGDGDPAADDLLLVGICPVRKKNTVMLGWLVTEDDNNVFRGDETNFKVFVKDGSLSVDFCDHHIVGGMLTGWESWFPWNGRTEDYHPDLLESRNQANTCCDMIMEVWAEASNRVQWHPKEAR